MTASLKIGSFQWLPSPLKAVNLLPDKKKTLVSTISPVETQRLSKDRFAYQKKIEEYEAEQAALYPSFSIRYG